jgi:hypothetical protein
MIIFVFVAAHGQLEIGTIGMGPPRAAPRKQQPNNNGLAHDFLLAARFDLASNELRLRKIVILAARAIRSAAGLEHILKHILFLRDWPCTRVRYSRVTSDERTLLSAWLKQGRDRLML